MTNAKERLKMSASMAETFSEQIVITFAFFQDPFRSKKKLLPDNQNLELNPCN